MPQNIITEGAGGIDTITMGANGRFVGVGNTAMRLLQSGFNINALRPNGVLQKDEWKRLDDAVVQIARSRLVLANLLTSRGLTTNLPNALGITRVEWETVSDMNGAQIDMSGLTESQNDRVVYGLAGIPIPIIHKDFHINIRALAASRNRGEPVDTTQVEISTRKVAEKLESLILSGGYSVGVNGTIYGLLNAPNRNTGSVTASWVTATGAQIVADVLAMIAKAQADHFYGPYVLIVPTAAMTHMSDDYKAESDRTILERVRAISNIAAVIEVDEMAAPNVLLVQLTRDVIDLIIGMGPTVVMWETMGGMQMNFKVMAIQVPRMKNDQLNQSGIVHYS
ncbi:MAG: major capsid protein [Nitrospira sp.]